MKYIATKLAIKRNEVLRYLGDKNKNSRGVVCQLIDDVEKEVLEAAEPRYVYRIFDIKKNRDSIQIENTDLVLYGKTAFSRLQHAKKCALMAVTLGHGIEQKLRFYARSDLGRAVVFDACATAAVEELCNVVENEIKKIAAGENMFTTPRFSPGCGDFSIRSQKNIINILDASRKIGLFVTDSCILLPVKSVTAVIGVCKEQAEVWRYPECRECSRFSDCIYRKEGDGCEF